MKRITLLVVIAIASGLVLVVGGTSVDATKANAAITINEGDGGGGTSWACSNADAAAGKMIFGNGHTKDCVGISANTRELQRISSGRTAMDVTSGYRDGYPFRGIKAPGKPSN